MLGRGGDGPRGGPAQHRVLGTLPSAADVMQEKLEVMAKPVVVSSGNKTSSESPLPRARAASRPAALHVINRWSTRWSARRSATGCRDALDCCRSGRTTRAASAANARSELPERRRCPWLPPRHNECRVDVTGRAQALADERGRAGTREDHSQAFLPEPRLEPGADPALRDSGSACVARNVAGCCAISPCRRQSAASCQGRCVKAGFKHLNTSVVVRRPASSRRGPVRCARRRAPRVRRQFARVRCRTRRENAG